MSGIKDKIGSASNWVTVATAAVGLYFAVRAGLTLGSTIIVCFYLALASVVWLYPWKYSTLPPEEGFYKVMLISCRVLLLAPIIIAVAWATACLFWQQSPGMLVEKIKTAFVNEP